MVQTIGIVMWELSRVVVGMHIHLRLPGMAFYIFARSHSHVAYSHSLPFPFVLFIPIPISFHVAIPWIYRWSWNILTYVDAWIWDLGNTVNMRVDTWSVFNYLCDCLLDCCDMIIFIHTTMCRDRQTDRPEKNNTINTAVKIPNHEKRPRLMR